MPAFPWLETKIIDSDLTPEKLKAFKLLGVPYTEEDIAGAKASVEGKTELDAVVAYLQSLGLALKDKR
ncbi:MAG: cytochrome-c oxidase, cbb3-type subunit II, partial [Kangiellaceae bacterium]|nr:cytochrome-c oxidase, cbb3-type subunit II [Kangiellaceae bacterium]